MHVSSQLRMKWFVENYVSKIKADKIRVLDVGSYDVNGTYKPFFADARFEYVGLDIEKGPNVDLVLANPYDWSSIPTDSFDVVISGQAFEHTEFFWLTMAEIARVMKKDGLTCIIAPLGFEEHRYPVDCYRFYTDGMVAIARYVGLKPLHAHTNCAPSENDLLWYSEKDEDSMLVAQKPYSGATQLVDVSKYVCVPPDHQALNTGLIPFQPKKRAIRFLIKQLQKLI